MVTPKKLIDRLKFELGDECGVDQKLLTNCLDGAIEAINRRRGYRPTGTLPVIEEKYEWLAVQMATAAYNKKGAEGQTAHSEGDVSRTYGNDGLYPTELLQSIVPLVGFTKR